MHQRISGLSSPICMTRWPTPPPPWDAYCALMAFHLVVLDKRPLVCPVVIRETLCRALSRLVLRAAGYQVKTSCGTLQMCAGLDSGIDRETNSVGEREI